MSYWEEEDGYLSLEEKEAICAGATIRYIQWCDNLDVLPKACLTDGCVQPLPCIEHIPDYRGEW